MDVVFDCEQEAVINLVSVGRNCFSSGPAGTGKSVVIKRLKEVLFLKYGEDNVFLMATTGLAASAIGGRTVHSVLAIGCGRG